MYKISCALQWGISYSRGALGEESAVAQLSHCNATANPNGFNISWYRFAVTLIWFHITSLLRNILQASVSAELNTTRYLQAINLTWTHFRHFNIGKVLWLNIETMWCNVFIYVLSLSLSKWNLNNPDTKMLTAGIFMSILLIRAVVDNNTGKRRFSINPAF